MFREMRRIKQQVGKEECEAILKTAPRGVLAVLGDEGYPYAVPIDFYYEDGHIYIHGAKQGHKIDAMRGCSKVSFCVLSDGVKEENDWWYHFTSVICFGEVRFVEEKEESYALLRKIGRKYFPTVEPMEQEMRESADHAQVIDITVQHMTGKKIKEK